MLSALDVQFAFLDKSCLTIATHFPHSAVELRHAPTTNSASELQASLQAVPREQFPENHRTVSLSDSKKMSRMIPAHSAEGKANEKIKTTMNISLKQINTKFACSYSLPVDTIHIDEKS
jgi:hypothetical protein